MKHNTLLAVAGAVALGATGFAHAGTSSDTGTVTVNVEGTCEMIPAHDKLLDLGSTAVAMEQPFMVTVRCSDQLPYILENNAAPMGKLQVVDISTGRAYDVAFKNLDTGFYWGSNLNGEAYNGVGNGTYQSHSMAVSFNMDGAYGRAQVGVYEGDMTQTVSF